MCSYQMLVVFVGGGGGFGGRGFLGGGVFFVVILFLVFGKIYSFFFFFFFFFLLRLISNACNRNTAKKYRALSMDQTYNKNYLLYSNGKNITTKVLYYNLDHLDCEAAFTLSIIVNLMLILRLCQGLVPIMFMQCTIQFCLVSTIHSDSMEQHSVYPS